MPKENKNQKRNKKQKSNSNTKSNSTCKCKSREFHNRHSEKEKTVQGSTQNIIHERVETTNRVNKVFIQPIERKKETLKTIVVTLPTKHIKEGCKDMGVTFADKDSSDSSSTDSNN